MTIVDTIFGDRIKLFLESIETINKDYIYKYKFRENYFDSVMKITPDIIDNIDKDIPKVEIKNTMRENEIISTMERLFAEMFILFSEVVLYEMLDNYSDKDNSDKDNSGKGDLDSVVDKIEEELKRRNFGKDEKVGLVHASYINQLESISETMIINRLSNILVSLDNKYLKDNIKSAKEVLSKLLYICINSILLNLPKNLADLIKRHQRLTEKRRNEIIKELGNS